MTERTDLNQRIKELLVGKSMSLQELAAHTGASDMGIRSSLRAMVQRGELWRTIRKDKIQMFQLTPLKAKCRG